MTDQIPPTPIQPAKRSLRQRISIVWVVPLVALAIALGIAWQAYSERGPLIEIRFENASGIVAEQTQLRYRELSVGVVEEITFSDDLSEVIAHLRLDKDVANFVDSEALFWVVQPEVSARGVSGLQTVLSGVYIEGSWDGSPGGLSRHFDGLSERPIARPDQEGTKITLFSRTGKGLSEGSPILFKGLEVGQLGKPTLSDDGVTISADAFISAPHDTLLTTQSRFWNASGIAFNLGAGGASVDVESVAALISGGVSFETVVSGGEPILEGQRFAVFENLDDARESLFEGTGPDEGTLELSMVFDENVTGLNIGAQVTLNGLPIGEVVGITGQVDPEQFGDERVRLVVVLSIELNKLDAAPDSDTSDAESAAILDLFEQAVAEGWRARLARAGLLSNALRIEMVQIEDPEPAEFLRDADPYPIFPSVQADLEGGANPAEGLIQRVGDLPIEEILNSAKTFLDGAAALVASDDIQAIPGDLRGTVEEVRGAVGDVRGVIGSEQFQALPARLDDISGEISSLLAELEQRDGIARLVEAIDRAGEAAQEIGTAAEGVPALVAEISAVAEDIASLELGGMVDEASGLIGSARELVSTEAAQALPESLRTAVDEVATAVSELRSGGTIENANAALENVSELTADLSEAAANVPALVEDIRALTAQAAAMDLDALASEVTALLDSAEAVIGTEAARALPESLRLALDEIGTAVAELREGGTVESVNAALDSAEKAADAVADASSELPDLVRRTEAVLREAELALAGLSDSGALNREARETLREVSRAADSVRSLMRTLERKPNALLTGK
ncbi:MlaD family protein [Tropicimonas sp. TH_r6]|uniref:MlaD family protein n=1 Tax=Tropicimonas sp. TH_r6 TaxID=3082085 RepID=UPI0029536498|nr:MlaD family protein [Tropicimonas sp. TH_r6]MDV7142289.1 MlaD family protein [Tropicimonas sp. TH_r6]